jgi:pimeloyl-ACP methyl ester carboxylesterase
MKNLSLATLMISAATLAVSPASAQDGFPTGTAKNIVLVHGAFADETGWSKVAALLSAEGYHVTAVKNPLTSLEDDLAATQAVLDAQDGPTVLVGHSWGGVVIGEAGDDAKVSALVYVSAFAPDKGETLGALAASGPATEGLQKIVPDDKGFLSIDPAAFPTVFAGDLPRAEAEAMAANQLPINHTAFEAVAAVAAWHEKPSWYVITAKDLMLDAEAQGFFAQRMSATTVTVEGSHSSYISHPEEIAAAIESAAAAR